MDGACDLLRAARHVCLPVKCQDSTTDSHRLWREMGRGGGLEFVIHTFLHQAFCFRVVFSLMRLITFLFRCKTSIAIRVYERVEMPEQWLKEFSFGNNSG